MKGVFIAFVLAVIFVIMTYAYPGIIVLCFSYIDFSLCLSAFVELPLYALFEQSFV